MIVLRKGLLAMRRRQIYAAQSAATNAQVPPPVEVRAPEPVRKIGECPKCHKIIGRGLHFHMKACNA